MASKESTTKVIDYFPPSKLPTNVLPTQKNVICAINFEQQMNRKKCSEAINIVATDIVSLWKKISLPVINVSTVRPLIKKIHQSYLNIVYHQNRPAYSQEMKNFKVYEMFFT